MKNTISEDWKLLEKIVKDEKSIVRTPSPYLILWKDGKGRVNKAYLDRNAKIESLEQEIANTKRTIEGYQMELDQLKRKKRELAISHPMQAKMDSMVQNLNDLQDLSPQSHSSPYPTCSSSSNSTLFSSEDGV